MVVAASGAEPELRLHGYFSDNVVLQREKPVLIKAWANAGAEVTVTFGDQKQTGMAGEDGAWTVMLDPMPASAKPRKLTVHSPLATCHSTTSSWATC